MAPRKDCSAPASLRSTQMRPSVANSASFLTASPPKSKLSIFRSTTSGRDTPASKSAHGDATEVVVSNGAAHSPLKAQAPSRGNQINIRKTRAPTSANCYMNGRERKNSCKKGVSNTGPSLGDRVVAPDANAQSDPSNLSTDGANDCVSIAAMAAKSRAITGRTQTIQAFCSDADDSIDMQEKDVEHLHMVLESFYEDRLKPFHQDLKRRIGEKYGSERLLPRYLDFYKSRPDLFIVCQENSKTMVTLVHPPKNFAGWIDPNDPNDPYPPELWAAFRNCITKMLSGSLNQNPCSCETPKMAVHDYTFGLPTEQHNLCSVCGGVQGKTSHPFQKGGRYGMAYELYNMKIPLMKGYCLGQVCHIVQLAIVKGFLAYENELLKPVSACTKITIANCSSTIGIRTDQKMSNSELGLPHIAQRGEPIRDLQKAKEIIANVLENEEEGIHLAHLKQRILTNHHKYITPTAFGYEKLSALLSCEVFSDTCYLLRDDINNHMIVQSTKYPIRKGVKRFVSSKTEAKARMLEGVNRLTGASVAVTENADAAPLEPPSAESCLVAHQIHAYPVKLTHDEGSLMSCSSTNASTTASSLSYLATCLSTNTSTTEASRSFSGQDQEETWYGPAPELDESSPENGFWTPFLADKVRKGGKDGTRGRRSQEKKGRPELDVSYATETSIVSSIVSNGSVGTQVRACAESVLVD